ncbi:hypothetical protein [Rhodanobacter sp. DHG33]|uniref:hypothetical protein n=1 Tax=Rhodanobacter sp. DHG33 TaxID=2775921 RepID=UPI00177EAE22|nr:hypothetical protein [Rhodanobacter sp. DHG33]MBD8900009.1 hypothetical protein [Rhodanobacter sp. DHG33]
MKLEIKSFGEAGNLEEERLVLHALDDVDIGNYVVLRSKRGASGTSPTSGSKDAYWFPDTTVKAGDLVIIYTRKGNSAKKELSGGRTAHFFYWHKSKPFWSSDAKNTAVLIETKTWRSKVPET